MDPQVDPGGQLAELFEVLVERKPGMTPRERERQDAADGADLPVPPVEKTLVRVVVADATARVVNQALVS